MFKGGLDYACYITTAVEYDGSPQRRAGERGHLLGKGQERAKQTTLYADATIVLPFIATYTLTKISG